MNRWQQDDWVDIETEDREKLKTIKKGTKLLVNNGLGECTAYSMESIKQGRGFKSTLLVDLKASEVGFFDEIGSIYVEDIIEVVVDK